ncbi:MAG: hypothetical protein HOC71_03320 [Candidatus Latescibacteria bacterium]|jgi:hypothetical protein|nr:hypothetical protein [Candidatus Latescibacterota bacterium]
MRSFIFSSNTIRLSWKNWVVVICIFILIFSLFPQFWGAIEKFNPSSSYRLPYILSSDYWMFRQWCKSACTEYPALIIGDSVVWGQYVRKDRTLSHFLNDMAGKDMFANTGVDGIHPAAMVGLINYFGKDIEHKNVIINLNPLWMSSIKHDLSSEEEFRFNHPRLVPQIIPDIACYRPSFNVIMGVVLERNIPFFSWLNHIRINHFENLNIQNWNIQNPYVNPLSVINLEIPVPDNNPKSKPITWQERGIKTQNFPWIPADESFQWSSFKRVIKILIERENNIYILFGPFNPYILTEESYQRFQSMKSDMEKWFLENNLSYYSVPDLPSDYYADGSHPLKEGYKKIAVDLFKTESFKKWMKNL